jgi:hypothetical protein
MEKPDFKKVLHGLVRICMKESTLYRLFVFVCLIGLAVMNQNCSGGFKVLSNVANSDSSQGGGDGGGGGTNPPPTNPTPPIGSTASCLSTATADSNGVPTANGGTVYYVRPDGGDATQCDGKSDAAYPGGSGVQHCAWSSPAVALPPNTYDSNSKARIQGGDTLYIKKGSYQIGLGAPGTASLDSCNSSYAYACTMQPPPSGTAAQPTRIIGEGWDKGCPAAPQLWGNERVHTVLDLSHTSYVQVSCLEVTDHDNCILNYNHANPNDPGFCPGSSSGDTIHHYPYGPWGAVGIYSNSGVNETLSCLNIHGMADQGIQFGNAAGWVLDRVRISANGSVGLNGDLGDHATDSVSDPNGTFVVTSSEISWNGCTENYPSTDIINCWGQNGAGGWGDAIGTASSPRGTVGHWTFQDTNVMHNVSDGIDLLHASPGVSVNIIRVHSEGNGGNQIKVSGDINIQDTVAVGNCDFFDGMGLMGKGPNGDNCRARGNTLSLNLFPNTTVTIKNSTITGQGDVLVVAGCDANGCESDPGLPKINLYNNIVYGFEDFPKSDGELTTYYYFTGSNGYESATTGLGVSDKNVIYRVKNNVCPAGNICTDPLMTAESDVNHIDATLTSNSPAIGAADPAYLTPTDFLNKPRTSNDIGAYQH